MSMRCGLQTLLEAARFVELQEEFEKQQLVTLHAAEEPLLSNKDAGYHPTSVTLPSSDLPASLNHIEPPITPPRQQQQSQQQLHQQATPVALQQQHPQQLQLQLHQPQQQTPQQQQQQSQQQLQLQLHQPVQQHHAVYKPAVTATAVAVTANNNNNNTTAVALVNSHDENVAALSLAQELKRRTGSGTREVHNKLEKNRRAHLKECFELLKKQVPASQDEKKTSNLSILRSAIRYIQVLRRRERELEHEMERLAREKIWAQQRHASLKKELAAKWDHIDFSKLLPDLPPDVTTRKTTIAATSINGDFETERDASMVTSDADDSKLSALYSSTSSLSSSSPPTLPFVSDIIPHQVQVVSTSPMMGSTIHIVPQTRNSSSLPPNALQQQTLTFVHHKDALNQHDGTTQAVLTKVSNGSFTLYGDPKLTPNRSKMSLAGIKIGTSVIDHSNNTASAPIRLLQNNIIAAQTSVVQANTAQFKKSKMAVKMIVFAACVATALAEYAAPAYPVHHAYAPEHSYESPTPYNFEYSVNDPHSYDVKSQSEHSDGHGNVKGSYSLLEADGSTRVVEYTADHSGFNAEVKKIEGHSHGYSAPAPVYKSAPAYKPAYAAHSYAAPAHSYAYAAPAHSYVAPAHSYAVPAHSYAAPAHSYAAPAHSYAYAAPAHSYAAPAHSYATPAHSYAYAAPAHSYSAPAYKPVAYKAY